MNASLSQWDVDHPSERATGLAPTTIELPCLGCQRPVIVTFDWETVRGNTRLAIAQVTAVCHCRLELKDVAEMLRIAGESGPPS
jgi:hypothetical protein